MWCHVRSVNAALKDVRERVSVIDGLRDRIAITVTSAGSSEGASNAGSIYGIVYQGRNRARSLKVVGELLNTLIVDKGDMTQNIKLQPGDVIVVPETHF